MNQKEKRELRSLKMKQFGLYTVMFIIILIVSYVLIFSFLYALQKFVNIDLSILFFVPIGLSFFTSIILSVLVFRRKKRTKLSFWFSNNYPKILLSCIILIILFMSISNKPLWDHNEIHEVLSIEWTVLGLSITIFLVWHVVFIGYLKKKEPKPADNLDFIQEYDLMNEKQTFYNEVLSAKSTMILLSINLLFLVFSTSLIYISQKSDSVITQNIVVFTFYLSTNTIIMLFIDMLQPILLTHKELRLKNKVTKEEMDDAEGKALLQTLVDTSLKTIDNMKDLSDKSKNELKVSFLRQIKDEIIGEKHKDSGE